MDRIQSNEMYQSEKTSLQEFGKVMRNNYICTPIAEIAQLVERWLPKPKVAGPSPVFRSKK